MFIGIIGGGKCSKAEADMAEEVGQLLAEREVILICGGLGGVMEAACKGARKAGGTTIGILPGNAPASANKYVDIPIVTGMGEARNVIIVKSVQAVIALGGEFGTLSEIGLARKNDIPVIGLNTWSFSRQGMSDNLMIMVEDPAIAVEMAMAEAIKKI
jgi:hypothetical protein